MATTKTVEIFSAGCPLCDEGTALVRRMAGDAAVTVRNMADPEGERRARELGVRSLPAVAVDGRLAECCRGGGLREDMIRAALAQ